MKRARISSLIEITEIGPNDAYKGDEGVVGRVLEVVGSISQWEDGWFYTDQGLAGPNTAFYQFKYKVLYY